jgi:putative membrane protein
MYPQASIPRNDRTAYWLIGIVSVVVFSAVVLLRSDTVKFHTGFDAHVFARINAVINSTVSVLLVAGYILVMNKKYMAHKNVMLISIVLSGLFLVSYIAHHLLEPETHFGGTGPIRYFYFTILISHIFLAAIILPFILFTAYQSLSGDFKKHKKVARIAFPIWLYVSITGVLVYFLISPYYS